MSPVVLGLLLIAAAASATNFLEEKFHSGWENRWVSSTHKSDLGKFNWSAGKYFNDAEEDKGIQTSQDARFYAMSTPLTKFSNKGKDLIVQYVVKHEQDIDCGGGYVKIFPSTLDPTKMEGESPYNIMFGPDICGPGTRKVHVIFSYKGKNLLTKKNIPCKYDTTSHLYTLIVKPDNTYEVRIDGEKVESGSLYEDFDFLPPKQIKDPKVSKPSDWVDEKTIADPEDKKPEDWDQPEHIADPNAKKPEDWDDEMDGEWEPPSIDNPAYKGEWKAKQIPNPAYKGEWEHPLIDNPEYVHDDNLYAYDDFGHLGLDLWQVKSGTVFDNILVTDSQAEADKWLEAFKTSQKGEEAAKKAAEDAEAAKKAEEEKNKPAEEAAAADEDVVEDDGHHEDL
jgi:calreticulin